MNLSDVQNLSIDQITYLQGFENSLRQYLAKLARIEDFKNLIVSCTLEVKEYRNKRFEIVHNASFNLPGAITLIHQTEKWVNENGGLEIAIPNHTLIIRLQIASQKTDSKKEAEDATSFIPSAPRFSFEQMILSERQKSEITDALEVIKHKKLIYEDWGFCTVDSIPRSVLNFYGAPGTGKTMCAHAIAHYLGKPILKLNYSEIESKYVGEAAKNLQTAFDTARNKDAVLFFDEADSFLGKRIQNVTNGSDQALNSLRSQMLILLEEFSGIVLFATNLVTNFDPAFESRILKHIYFELPNEEARASILRKVLPSQIPFDHILTEEEYTELSKIIEGFSGREIKNAILDLLMTKAKLQGNKAIFTYEDLSTTFTKKQEEKKVLKSQHSERIKHRVIQKLADEAEERQIEKEWHEQHQESRTSEHEGIVVQ